MGTISLLAEFIAPLLLIIFIWETLAFADIIDDTLLSKPSTVIKRFSELLTSDREKTITSHAFDSMGRTLTAITIATIIGLSCGIILGLRRDFYDALAPIIGFLMPIPGIAWAPIMISFLGFGNPTIVSVGALAAFFPMLYNTSTGIQSIKKEMVWSARSMGASNLRIVSEVLLPGALPYIAQGFKLGLARGWRTIIAVEMLAATTGGLGYMIFDAREYLNIETIYTGILFMALVYLIVEKVLIASFEKHTILRWGMVR